MRTLGAAAAGAGFVALARRVAHPGPRIVDRRVRRVVLRANPRAMSVSLAPLDIAGYPAAYLPIAMWIAKGARRHGARHAELVTAAALGGWLAHRVAKHVYRRERPPRAPGRRRKKSGSFPSGHTVGATALYAGAAFVLHDAGLIDRREAALLGLGAPMLMGASRVALDWHWTTDVAAGWLLGGAVSLGIGALSAGLGA